MRPATVYLSHSDSDPQWVRSFARLLRARAVEAWHRGMVGPDESLAEEMERAIRGSDWIVLLIDRENVDWPSLHFDYGAAVGTEKRMISIVSADVDESQVPHFLGRPPVITRRAPEETVDALLSWAERLESIPG